MRSRQFSLVLAVLLLPCVVSAQLLAVLDKSKVEDAGLSAGKLEMLAQVVRGEAKRRLPRDISVLSEENTVSILRDMGVNLAACEGECEVEIARKLQADWLISTKLVRFGTQWTLQVNLFKTATGELVASERLSAKAEEELADGAERATGLLCVKVATTTQPAQGAGGRLGEQPTAWDPGALLGVVLNFESEPPGASLALDGSYLGETPLTREVAPGPHQLEWSLQRHESLTEAVQVEQKATLKRTLTPLFGWLSVESTPSGQAVYIDGTKVGDTPLTDHVLGHGPHSVLVGDSLFAYPQGERFNLAKGERKELRLEIPMREGGIVVRCTDLVGNTLEALVQVDSTIKGTSPLQLKLTVGEHLVSVGATQRVVKVVERQVETLLLQVDPSSLNAQIQSRASRLPGLRFVTIPAGEFLMGSPLGEIGRLMDEEPQHRVRISAFEMAVTEVTQAQWKQVMGDNPSHFVGDQLPVERVSWDAVQTFLTRLNQLDPGKGYRLPTEAEWEYACRSGSGASWGMVEDAVLLLEYAWNAVNAVGRTHLVAQKKANGWGLHDMHGNAWEWCQDFYGDYPSEAAIDPMGPETGDLRVRRGGGCYNSARQLRAATRSAESQSYESNNQGFRLCRNAQ